MVKLYLFFFLTALCIEIQAQTLNFQKYGVSEGLSSNTVFSTIEDKDGFIWISTEEGVDRFDGLNFKHYVLPSLYEYRTVNDVEYYLKIDSKNQIWLITLGGLLYRYDAKQDEFVLFYKIKDESNQSLYTFFIDHEDKLWFGMKNGVLILDPVTKLFRDVPEVKHLTSAIVQDEENRYYLGTDNGILVLDAHQQFLYNLLEVSSTKNTGLKESHIESLFLDEQNDRLWIGANKLGLCAFNLINFEFIKPKGLGNFKGLKIKSFERFSPHEIIIGIDGEGLLIWDLNKQVKTQEIKDEDNKPSSLSSKSIQQVFRNSNGVFFISTWRGGLNVYSPGKLNFRSIVHYPYGKNSLPNNVVMMLEEISPGIIGFGTDKGLSIWNKHDDTWKYVDIQNKDATHMSNSRSIAADQEGNIWATSYTDSLVLFKKKKNGTYYNTKDFHSELKNLNLIEVYSGQSDLIWLSNDDKKGIWYYSISSKKLGHYNFAVDNVQAMLTVSPERLAVGTATGLQLIDIQKRALVDLDIINTSRLKTAMISSLALDANKQLWVGTRYEGLFIINFYKNTLTRLTTDDGLPSNRIFALTGDLENMWASTSKGISRIDNRKDISNFTESDGLISVDFNYNAALKDVDGQLYFGTNEGVVTFDSKDINPVKSNKSLVFDEFYLNHKRVLSGEDSPLKIPLNETDLIELKHNQNSFSIGFSSIDFLHSDQGDFQWKLENFDEEWITNQGETSMASYTNLNPGNYVFKLRMMGQKGVPIANEKQVELMVLPPFWSTPWAFLIYLLSGLLLLSLLIYSNGLRIKSNHSKEKLHYLVNMAHEVKTPLMLITSPLTDLLKNSNVDATMQQGIQIALKNAELLHRQMVQFLDFKRLNVQQKDLSLDIVDLVQLLKDKVFVFKVLADKKNIDFSFNSNLDQLVLNTDERVVDKVVSNLVSNAIKYTNSNGKIVVELIHNSDKCTILVKDSGIGIPLGQRKKVFQLFYRSPGARDSGSTGSGVGLVLASDLAKLIKGKVKLEESSPKGSIFSFSFPFEKINRVNKVVDHIINDQEEHEDIISLPSRPKVLLVEDNEDFKEYSKNKLSGQFTMTTASNGYIGLEILKKEPHDIVISDIMMPKMNGRQLCMNLKKNIETCHVPVILLTGLGSKDHIIEGLECGADDYIVKPYDYELLISKIDALLQNRLVLKRKFLFHDEKEGEIVFSNKLDQEFIGKITQFVEDNISDANVSPKDLCELMGMSRTSFYHKLKALMDVSPNEFIRTIRLKKGRALLWEKDYNVSEVAYSVGFSDAKYFGTLFKKYYGQNPSAFVAEKKQKNLKNFN